MLGRFGELESAARKGVAVRLQPGVEDMADVVRALDEAGLRFSNVELHSPTLDDVFLAKTGRSLEGAGEEADEEAPDALRAAQRGHTRYGRSAGRRVSPSARVQLGTLARRSIARTLRQPVLIVPNVVFPLFILAVISAGAGEQATQVPGFPTDNYTTFFLAATLIQGASGAMTVAGQTLGDDIATGFLHRLSLTPLRAPVLIGAQLAGVAVLGVMQAAIYLLVGLRPARASATGLGGALALIARGTRDPARIRLARHPHRHPNRHGRGAAGHRGARPGPALPLVDGDAEEPDHGRLVQDRRHLQPDVLPGRGPAQPLDRRAGTARRWRWAAGSPARSRSSRWRRASATLERRVARA